MIILKKTLKTISQRKYSPPMFNPGKYHQSAHTSVHNCKLNEEQTGRPPERRQKKNEENNKMR